MPVNGNIPQVSSDLLVLSCIRMSGAACGRSSLVDLSVSLISPRLYTFVSIILIVVSMFLWFARVTLTYILLFSIILIFFPLGRSYNTKSYIFASLTFIISLLFALNFEQIQVIVFAGYT